MFFSKKEESLIVQAIYAAERHTSGEIRVYIEEFCDYDDPLERAATLFVQNGMHNTRERNAVLIYLADKSRQFAIWGDANMHQKAGPLFWKNEKQLLRSYLQKDEPCEGICAVIGEIGKVLKQHFPANKNDNPDELPNDIIYG